MRPTRRAVLSAAVVLSGTLAGCGGGAGNGAETDREGPATGGPEAEPTRTGTPGGQPEAETATTAPPDLDLREANVTGVETTATREGFRFDVTLYHDDDGEEGYADWWQVETLDGALVHRRELLHAHGTRPFTRSATVQPPSEVACVVVRGHDRTHGYGGRAVLVAPGSGSIRSVDQGPDPVEFGTEDCP